MFDFMVEFFFAKRLQELIEYYVKTFNLDYSQVLNLVNKEIKKYENLHI